MVPCRFLHRSARLNLPLRRFDGEDLGQSCPIGPGWTRLALVAPYRLAECRRRLDRYIRTEVRTLEPVVKREPIRVLIGPAGQGDVREHRRESPRPPATVTSSRSVTWDRSSPRAITTRTSPRLPRSSACDVLLAEAGRAEQLSKPYSGLHKG